MSKAENEVNDAEVGNEAEADESMETQLDESKDDESKADESKADESKDGEEKAKEEPPAEEVEEPQPSKKALLQPLVILMKEHLDKLTELTQTQPEGEDDKEDVPAICSEARKIRQLTEDVISVATTRKGKRTPEPKPEYQYVAKVQGLRQQHFKDLRNVLQNALGLGVVKFSPIIRNSPFVDVNFISEEVMEKGVKILRGQPLGVQLSVVETKRVDKHRLPPECVLNPLDTAFDPTFMLKESLLRSRELTEEELGKMLEWKDKYIKHVLKKTCDKLDPDIYTVIKDRTDGYLFKLEEIKAANVLESKAERYQTYSGVNTETGKVEMGYWVLGSDVPSRVPRTECIRDALKVLKDFMEASDKPFYDLRVRKGYWDSLMFRSNHESQCMAVLIVRAGGEKDAEKDCEALKPQLKELFEEGAGKDCGVKSVHLKSLSETGKAGAWHLLYGDEYLDEEVAGLKVRLYMNTLFWGDGGCAQLLCEAIAEELSLGETTGVLEMGVATGLMCMYLAKRCKMVCGLDRVQSVLPAAKENVELNDLTNVVLVQGSPTTTVTSLKTHFKECDDVHAVVVETTSNSRNKEEILGMRKATWIKKVAYVVVSYKDVTSSLRLLCSKHADNSEPFVIVKATPFDIASTSVRPDVLLVLERASALEDLIEKRVPKSKPIHQGGPAAKRARLAGAMGGNRPRSLLAGRKLGPPLMREPLLQGNRGYMDRGFGNQRNPGYGPQRGPMFPWSEGDRFDSEQVERLRLEEEEAILLERARRQKEAQLQQIQEVVLEAQRRRLANALLPTPPTANIEEVVLSAIKKTGLLEKVAALSDVPAKSQMDIDVPRRDADSWPRFTEQQSDRWSSNNYRQQGGGSSRGDTGRYDNRNSSEFRDRDTYGYGGRNASSPGNRERGSGRFKRRGSYGGGNSEGMYKSRRGYYN